MSKSPTKDIKVLLVEDDEDDYLITKHILGGIQHENYVIDWVDNYKEAKPVIQKNNHDVYLVDYRLGANTGLELLEELGIKSYDSPFILITGAGDTDIEDNAMVMGVADYLVKGRFDAELISRSIRYSLQRKQLELEAVKKYKELNRSKDEFIAITSHQLRTPATAVKQYLGMIIQGYAGKIKEEQKKFIDSAYASNERQLKVIDDILGTARLELERITLDKKPVDISDLISNVVEDTKPKLQKKNQKIIVDLCEDAIKEVDKNILQNAITNLVDNASKYSDNGKDIHLSLSKQKDHVIIEIADEGVGIKKDDYPKLFKKFSRIPNPLSAEAGGTGLGLHWAKEVVGLHGGEINVKPAKEKGTVFQVVL